MLPLFSKILGKEKYLDRHIKGINGIRLQITFIVFLLICIFSMFSDEYPL